MITFNFIYINAIGATYMFLSLCCIKFEHIIMHFITIIQYLGTTT